MWWQEWKTPLTKEHISLYRETNHKEEKPKKKKEKERQEKRTMTSGGENRRRENSLKDDQEDTNKKEPMMLGNTCMIFKIRNEVSSWLLFYDVYMLVEKKKQNDKKTYCLSYSLFECCSVIPFLFFLNVDFLSWMSYAKSNWWLFTWGMINKKWGTLL